MNADNLRSLLSSFERALERLSDALSQPKNEFLRDSAIQRFEFTFEFAWKIMKGYLALQGWRPDPPARLSAKRMKRG